jgi:hypothetical protein
VLFPATIDSDATETLMTKPIMTPTLAAAALAVGLCCDMTAAKASYDNAPWCLVRGGDDAYWDCEFRTFQDCLQARGGTGFCNVNPSGPPAPAAAAQPAERKRRS